MTTCLNFVKLEDEEAVNGKWKMEKCRTAYVRIAQNAYRPSVIR